MSDSSGPTRASRLRAIRGGTMSPELRRFSGQMSWSLLGGISAGGLLFILLVAGGRLLGPTEYGKSALVLAFGQVLIIPYMLGLDYASSRAIARAQRDTATARAETGLIVSSALAASLASIVVTSVLVLLLRHPLAHLVHTSTSVVWGAVAYGFTLGTKTLLERMLAGLERFRYQAISRLTESAIALTVFIALYASGALRSFLVIVVSLVGAGLFLIASYLWALRAHIHPRSIARHTGSMLFVYGRIAFMGYIFATLIAYADTFAVNRFLGTRELGIYTAYYTCSLSVLVQLMGAISNVFFPAMGRQEDKRQVIALLDRAVRRFFIPAVVVMVGVVIVIIQLYGGGYPLLWRLLGVISLWGVLFSTNATYALVVNAHNERSYRREIAFQPVRLLVLGLILLVLVQTDHVSLLAIVLSLLAVEVLETVNLRLIVRQYLLVDTAAAGTIAPVTEAAITTPEPKAASVGQADTGAELVDQGTRGRRSPVPWIAAAVAALAVVGLHLVHLDAVALVLAAAAVISATPRTLTLALRIMVGVVCVYTWTLPSAAVLQPFGAGLHPAWTLAPLAALGAGLAARSTWTRPRPTWNTLLGLVPLIVALTFGGFLLSAGITGQAAGTHHVDERVALLASSEDGASHYDVYRAVQQANGYLYDQAGKDSSALYEYPPAFHMNAAIINRTVGRTPGLAGMTGNALNEFWLSTIVAFVLLIAGISTAAGEVALRLGAGRITTAVAAFAVGGSVGFWYMFQLYVDDFFPQITSYWLLAVGLALLVVPVTLLSTRARIVALGALIAVTSFTWFFITPIFGIIAGGWLLLHPAERRKHWRFATVVFVLTIIVSFIPVLPNLHAATSGAVNNAGGVAQVSRSALYALVLIGFVGLGAAWTTVTRTTVRFLTLAFGTVVVFSVALREYQLHTIGHTAYFYEKSLYTILVVGLIVTAGSLAALVTRGAATFAPIGRWRAGATAVGVALAVPTMAGAVGSKTTNPAWAYRGGTQIAFAQREVFLTYFATRNQTEGRDIFVWNASPIAYQNYFGSRWTNALNGRSTKRVWAMFNTQLTVPTADNLVSYIHTSTNGVALFTRDPDLVAELKAARITPADLANTEIFYMPPLPG